MTDKSILEIETSDIQGHYGGNNISYDDLVNFAENKVSATRQDKPDKAHPQNIVNNQGFYVSQVDYIEYVIAKRLETKKTLKRKKISDSLYYATAWVLKAFISVTLLCGVCWGFYMLCWSIQKTF